MTYQAIPVTAKHIRTGQATSCKFCPIALALSESYNYVWAGLDELTIGDGIDAPKKYRVEWRVKDWMKAFDCGLDWVKPFVLILDYKKQTASMMLKRTTTAARQERETHQ